MEETMPHEGDCISWRCFDGGTAPWTFEGVIWSAAPGFKGNAAFWVLPQGKHAVFAGSGPVYVVRSAHRIVSGTGQGIGRRWRSGFIIEKGEFVEDRYVISEMARHVRFLKASRFDFAEWVPVNQAMQDDFFELCERLSKDGGGR